MKNSGKHLEQFVKQIEALLIPHGFTIESGERLFGDDGVQIAEFDIVISGKVGSAPFKMLIECRDRPSDGPVPASWIEQLVGRRTRFKFDKVVAVSTTGFTRGAEEFANNEQIELRSVETLTLDAVADWFNFRVFARAGMLSHVECHIFNEGLSNEMNKKLASIPPLDTKTLMLIKANTGEAVSIAAIWHDVFERNETIFNDMNCDETKQITVPVKYDDPIERYQLPTEYGLFPIDLMIFKAEFSIKQISPSLVAQYSETTGQPIAQTISFVINTGSGEVEVNWYNFKA